MKKPSLLARIGAVILVLSFLAPKLNNARAAAEDYPLSQGPLQVNVLDQLTEDLFVQSEANFKKSAAWSGPFERISALEDPADRVSPDFKVPPALKRRVAFWFDIYTKYGDAHHVVHHSRYPWIVFQVIDTTEIDNTPSWHRWTKYHKARKLVRTQIQRTRARLLALSKMKSYKNLTEFDRSLFAAVAELPGSRRKVFLDAARAMRTQLGQKDYIVKGLHHSPRYLPYMEQEFLALGLPPELTRIPFVESSFNPHAESKVGASGIWQIMPRTGRAYFTVNDYIDERNSPLKASLVAAQLLKHNYKALKQWPLAVTAYNHGATGVKTAMTRSKSKNLVEVINRYHRGSFKFASSNFFCSFLAVLHAEKYHNEIFADRLKTREQLLRYSVYSLAKPMRVKTLIKMLGVDKETFVTYNLDLKDAAKKNTMIPKNYRFLVPLERRLDLEAKSHLGIHPVRSAGLSSLKGRRG